MSRERRAGRDQKSRPANGLDRRAFLGLAASGAALLEGCARRDALFIEQPLQRSGLPGASIHRLSVCGQCSAGCQFDVRTVDGDGKKLEGLPAGPVNRGGLCALGQSALQEHYNPDRVTVPLRRRGERGAGDFEPVSWEEALAEVGEALASAATRGEIGDRPIGMVVGGGGPQAGLVGALWQRLAWTLGAPRPSSAEAPEIAVERRAAEIVLGRAALPVYGVSGSDWVLGVGASMLDRWRSPVAYARGVAAGRAGRSGRRAKLTQVESRQSLTAAAADEWLPARPGTEGVLLRALAGALLESETPAAALYRQWFPAAPPSLEEAAERCDLEPAVLRRVAAEMQRAERPLVVAGGSAVGGVHGLGTAVAALGLDLLLGAVERGAGEGGVSAGVGFGLEAELGEPQALESLARLGSRLRGVAFPGVEVLLVSEADPLHGAPRGWELRQLLEGIGKIVVVSAFLDDTAHQADLVLPVQTDLERLSVVEPEPQLARPTLLLSPPALETLGEARHPGDIALAVARASGASIGAEFPWEGFSDLVEAAIGSALEAGSAEGRTELPPFEGAGNVTASRYLSAALERGSIEAVSAPAATSSRPTSRGARDSSVTEVLVDPAHEGEETEGDADTYPFRMIPFESVKTGDGRGSNRPWLQELPDPLASVMWSSWAEVATADARRLGIATGDHVRLTSPAGAVELPAVVLPSVRPGCVAVPLGHGHDDFGRYARGRGVNAMQLVAGDLQVAGTESAVRFATRVRLERLEAAGRDGVAIYGRGLRQSEHIPSGWAPHEPSGHGPGNGESEGGEG